MAASENQRSVAVTVVGMTDVGRVRKHNEDSFLVLNHQDGRRAGNGEVLATDLQTATVFAVADGMGGAAAGEVASHMAAETVARMLGQADYSDVSPDQITSLLDHAVHEANEEILREATASPEKKGMGTTMTAAVAIPGRLFISQVGDSRGYLLRKGKLNRLTKDQSLIQQLIEEGTLTEEEAEKYGGRNIVLQAVGVEDNLRVDTKNWEVLRGDVVLLCSDGLTGMITDDDVERILNEAGDDLHTALERLIDAANEGGGRDNITAVLARFDGAGLRPPMEALGGGVEQAGARFAAPPPPDEPNPMRRVGGVLIALIGLIALLFVVLRRTTTDLTVSWTPADVAVTLRLLDPQGNEVRRQDATGGSASFEGLLPGRYRVAGAAPKYFEEQQDLTFDVGDAVATLALGPKPGSLKIRVATPRVRVDVAAEGSGGAAEPMTKSQPSWPDPTVPIEFESGVPAGPVTVTVSREGFRRAQQAQTLAPEGHLDFAFPALEEVLGSLRIASPGPGFHAVVVNGQETVAEGDTAADGVLVLRVRTGSHELRLTRPGYDEFVRRVEIAEAERTELAVDPTVQTVPLAISGVPGTTFSVERHTGDGWVSFGQPSTTIYPNGLAPRPISLPPGRYRVRYGDSTVPVEVKPGDTKKSLRLE